MDIGPVQSRYAGYLTKRQSTTHHIIVVGVLKKVVYSRPVLQIVYIFRINLVLKMRVIQTLHTRFVILYS